MEISVVTIKFLPKFKALERKVIETEELFSIRFIKTLIYFRTMTLH